MNPITSLCSALNMAKKNWKVTERFALLESAELQFLGYLNVQTFWNVTRGQLNKGNIIALRDYVLTKYSDLYAQRKVLNFSNAFLKHLAKIRFELRYAAFDLFLEFPKSPKTRKRVTSRIVTNLDVENALCVIERAYETQEIDRYQRLNYKAIVLSALSLANALKQQPLVSPWDNSEQQSICKSQ